MPSTGESAAPVTYELYAIPPPLDNKVALFELQSKINSLESKIIILESFVPEIQELVKKMEKIESEAAKKINMRKIDRVSLDKQVINYVEELYKYFSEVGGYVKQLPPLVKRLKVFVLIITLYLQALENLHHSAIDLTNRFVALEKSVNQSLTLKEQDKQLLETV